MSTERRLAAILMADVVGSSRLTETDERYALSEIQSIFSDILIASALELGGRLIKTIGDGALFEFASPVSAVACAEKVQRKVMARAEEASPDRQILLRIGINLGDVVVESDGDLRGDGVNVAARLESLADPGGIAISSTVHDHLAGKNFTSWVDRGLIPLKNISRPVRVWVTAPAPKLAAPIMQSSRAPHGGQRAIFVHLSDIHFGQEKDGGSVAINDDAKERLIEDARAEMAKLAGKASGIIVTGDIAFSGKKHEYKAAAQWLARLTDAVGCERVNVQMIPGNHDIDRDKISTAIKCLLEAIRERGDSVLDPLLDDPEDCKVLYSRFEAYADFALDYQSELDLNGGLSHGGRLELARGRSIRFVRLNSALICSRKDDEGKLILGKRQQTLPIEDGEELIVLVHHPLNWFQDSANARRYLRSRARMIISGHEHYPKLDIETVEDGCELMLLAAGATNPDDAGGNYTYKYNILVFEWDEQADALSVTVNPRTWDENTTRFKRDDVFMEGRADRQVLASPNFRRAPRPLAGQATNQSTAKGPPEVEPIIVPSNSEPADAPADPFGSDFEQPTQEAPPALDERLLQLRFFQELAEGGRLRALVELGAVPATLKGRLDHAMERRLFRLLMKKGKAQAIEQWLTAAQAEKGSRAL